VNRGSPRKEPLARLGITASNSLEKDMSKLGRALVIASLTLSDVAPWRAGPCFGGSPQDQAPPRTHSRGQPDDVDVYLQGQMDKRHIPGLQVAVVRRGEIVKLAAYGLANVQDAVAVDDRTVFQTNSITKAFVGVAIMQLVEDGKVDLAAPPSRYLGGLPAAWQSVTIRQLLNHTSGIPDIWDARGRLIADGEDAAWAKVRKSPMEFAPGEQFRYNQANYVLLGRVIDKVSGQPFTQFIKARQFDVAGMRRSGFFDSYDLVPHRARVYRMGGGNVGGGKLGCVFDDFPPSLRTAAGLNSTAEEIARWVIALLQGRLLTAKGSLATLWTPGVLNDGAVRGFGGPLQGYALGWPTTVPPERRAVGGIGGGRSAFFIYPDDDLAVVVLTNLQFGAPESLVFEVAGRYVRALHPYAGFGLPPAIKAFRAELLNRGFGHAAEVFGEMKQKDPKFRLPELDVNAWGYVLLEQEQTKEAIEIFKLNVRLYPKSANTYDSLAEAYEAGGDRALAIKNYRRSLELDPKNTHAVEHLKTLESNQTRD
jgi:CubicO group peptidase (beta-lactamase class C family)